MRDDKIGRTEAGQASGGGKEGNEEVEALLYGKAEDSYGGPTTQARKGAEDEMGIQPGVKTDPIRKGNTKYGTINAPPGQNTGIHMAFGKSQVENNKTMGTIPEADPEVSQGVHPLGRGEDTQLDGGGEISYWKTVGDTGKVREPMDSDQQVIFDLWSLATGDETNFTKQEGWNNGGTGTGTNEEGLQGSGA